MTPDELEAIRERYKTGSRHESAADVPALLAALAEAQRREELMRPVVEAAQKFVHGKWTVEADGKFRDFLAAIRTYETQTGGTDDAR